MTGLVRGVVQPVHGLTFLARNRPLWKYAIIPALLNLIVIVVAGWFLVDHFDELFTIATSFVSIDLPSSWYRWPDWLLRWLFTRLIGLLIIVVSLVVLYVVFLLVAAILSSPFNDALSERTEQLYRGQTVGAPFSLKTIVTDSVRTVLEALSKAAFFLAAFALFLPLHLIPVIGSVSYAVLSVGFTMFFLTLEFVDFSMSRRRFDFAQKRATLMRHKGPVLGFGATMFAAITIPFANLVMLPIGVVAGTMLYLDLEEPAVSSPEAVATSRSDQHGTT